MNKSAIGLLVSFLLSMPIFSLKVSAQIINAYGRNSTSLNGEWHAIVDLNDRGKDMGIFKNKKPTKNNEFREYSFDDGLILNVPGDYNSQKPELKYYEGPLWYGRYFDAFHTGSDERLLLYFAAVANKADVYLNGEHIGSHDGGFLPFQIDITDKVKDSDNFLAVYTDSHRHPEDIPAMNFDWWNYGGITRDVMLINVPDNHISDYFIRLGKDSKDRIDIDISLSQKIPGEKVSIEIPELKIKETLTTDNNGEAAKSILVKHLERWDVDNPKLYEIHLMTSRDTVSELIGFRDIRTEGEKIMLNGRPVFLCGVNLHEEIPQRKGRAFSEADAAMLLSEAKAMGANFIRLAHYPQNEHLVRMAEKMGFMMWEEIPVWQNIDFSNEDTKNKAAGMMADMINRDKNRASIAVWSIANETWPSEARNEFLAHLRDTALSIDDSRLIGAAFNNPRFNSEKGYFELVDDPIADIIDVVGVNKYVGWYENWPTAPSATKWKVAEGKPLVFSEFGGEALFGEHGNTEAKWSWSEDYQANLYRDNIKMFDNIPNLAGTCPWVLFDFRSPTRFSPMQGLEFNRKGLISDRGERKEAWHVMRDYYKRKNTSNRN